MLPRLKIWLIGMSKFKHPELFIYSWFRVVSGWSTAETIKNKNRKKNKQTTKKQALADEVKEMFVG